MSSSSFIKSPADVARFIDHTLLKPEATSSDIERLCAEAREHRFLTVCVNSVYISLATQLLADSAVQPIAVVGFPLGACGTATKCFEAERAIADGACEIDMVIWTGGLKSGRVHQVGEDIREMVRACAGIPLKVIIETALLTRDEKVLSCQLARDAGAQFVKTCTGFLGGAATVQDIELMRATVGPEMGVKASGGIRDFKTAQALLQAGATRLGTSSSVAIVENTTGTSTY